MNNLIVFGVGHSGTTVLTKMLHALGWKVSKDNDPEYFEPTGIRNANELFLQSGSLPENARELIGSLVSPWVIKDPRFMVTISSWREILNPFKPSLVWVVRDIEAVKESYRRRGEHIGGVPNNRGYSIEESIERCGSVFSEWPFGKLKVNYESISEACSLWIEKRSW